MKFDLHIHSNHSYDSLSSVNSIIKHAKKCGLSGIAITDHNSFSAISEIPFEDDKFWVIPGSENHTEVGDIIGLFISKPLKAKKSIELVKEIHDQNGIAILAHPFKRMQIYPEYLISYLDAIEVVNSRWVDLNAYEYDQRVANLLHSVPGRSAGSDAHFLFEVGRAYLSTPLLHSQKDLKRIIVSGDGKVYANSFSSWLDEASQLINLYKNPSFYQTGRIFYRLIRRILKRKRSKI